MVGAAIEEALLGHVLVGEVPSGRFADVRTDGKFGRNFVVVRSRTVDTDKDDGLVYFRVVNDLPVK